MATPEIKYELVRILDQVIEYKGRGQVEELIYLVGAGMMTLEQMGCPIHNLRLQAEKIIDEWANSTLVPVRS